jgi:hypothetical protein
LKQMNKKAMPVTVVDRAVVLKGRNPNARSSLVNNREVGIVRIGTSRSSAG